MAVLFFSYARCFNLVQVFFYSFWTLKRVCFCSCGYVSASPLSSSILDLLWYKEKIKTDTLPMYFFHPSLLFSTWWILTPSPVFELFLICCPGYQTLYIWHFASKILGHWSHWSKILKEKSFLLYWLLFWIVSTYI